MSALEQLAATKARADSSANLDRYIANRLSDGWSNADASEYRKSIAVLMGSDDAAALALFPVETYQTAEQARQGAREFWAQQLHSTN